MALPSSGPLTFSDIQTEFGGSNPIGLNEYYAGGGLVPSGTTGTYGAVPTSGQISVQNFYGTSNIPPTYIEDVFSTWLYYGNSSTQTITNGINLSGNGGLVWAKSYLSGGGSAEWALYDTTRGTGAQLRSNSAGGNIYTTPQFSSFNSNGFSLNGPGDINYSGHSIVSYTFRKQTKFFDIVYYTGNGSSKTISHNLGSVPGCILVKSTSTGNWMVYHRSLGNAYNLFLNGIDAAVSNATVWNSTSPTSTTFTVGSDSAVNANGQDYIAYLFAHDAGGFGASGSANVISCGSFTANGSGSATVNLGYEPQWVLVKCSTQTNNWAIANSMQYFVANGTIDFLRPNVLAGIVSGGFINPNSTGFSSAGGLVASQTYVYVAIRRGLMKTPTTGTSVFSTVQSSGGAPWYKTSFPVDAGWGFSTTGGDIFFSDRLRGATYLVPYTRATEVSLAVIQFGYQDGWHANTTGLANYYAWNFRRASGFFDEVCYIGTGANSTVTHNLGVVPELMIVKRRTGSYEDWAVYTVTNGNTSWLVLNSDVGPSTDIRAWNNTTPTASVFTVGTGDETNQNGQYYVAYLFATCSGVSKVGSYTGTGALQTINCGFTGGARFVLIRRSDNTGDWYVWDSTRGISSSTDPYILLNSNAAQVTGTNYVDTTSVGFQVTAAAPAGLNASGGTYFFLAIA